MRRNQTVTAGWSPLTPVMDAGGICTVTCKTNIAWRLGLTEIQVFGVNPPGDAVAVGLPGFSYQ